MEVRDNESNAKLLTMSMYFLISESAYLAYCKKSTCHMDLSWKSALGCKKMSWDPMIVLMKEDVLRDYTYHDLLIPTNKAYFGLVEPIETFPSNTRITVRCKS